MKLKTWMKKAKASDTEFARRLGVARETASRLRRGKMVPSLRLAAEIYRATDGKVKPLDLIDPSELDPR